MKFYVPFPRSGKEPPNTPMFGYLQSLGQAVTAFTCQSIGNSVTPILPTIQVLRTKDLRPQAILAFATQILAFHPTLARPVLFHENLALINFACTLTGLICNSLLHQQEELSFSHNAYSIQDWLSMLHAVFIQTLKIL